MKSWRGTIRDKLSVMIFRVLGEKAASRLPPYSTPAASSGNCPAGPEAEKNSPHSRSVDYPFLAIVDTAPIACAAGSMKLLTVRLSVCLSVPPSLRPIIRLQHAVAAGLLLWARHPRDINRMLHGRRSAAANASSVTLSADVGS